MNDEGLMHLLKSNWKVWKIIIAGRLIIMKEKAM